MPDSCPKTALAALAIFLAGATASCASAQPTEPPVEAQAAAQADAQPEAEAGAADPEAALAEAVKEWGITDPPGDWNWRDAAIDTTEGTWMNLDVSPDGSTIVFDMLGDIYTIPFAGGDATPVRTGLAWDMQPRFSPDGAKIAFTSDAGDGDNIWIMNADGTEARQVTKESFRLLNNPAWDPSGQFIVARKHFTSKRSLGAGEMWLYHTSGGSGAQMTKRPDEQKDVNDPAFSPDGRYLYYDRDASPGRQFQYNKDSSGQIYVIERLDRETGDIERIAGGAGGAIRPTPSPDGETLAFLRRVDYDTVLFLKNLETGEETPILEGLERDNQEAWSIHGVYPTMAWTPDSQHLVFWDDGHIKRIEVASREVTQIPFRVRTTMRVAEAVRSPQPVFSDTFDVKMLRGVTVSPQGDRVAYVALGHVWVKDLPGGEPRRLTSLEGRFEHDPAFSRDGQSIVFGTWSDRDLGELRIAPASGGNGRVITPRPGHFVDPVFSPDGNTVVFRQTGAGFLRSPLYSDDTGVYSVPAAGGEMTRITGGGADAHFGARNDRLYVMRSSGDETSDTRTLVAIDLNRVEDDRELYTTSAAQAFRVSPDGKWLAFREGFHVHITPLVETGRTVSIGAGGSNLPVAKVTKQAGDNLDWAGDSAALYWSLGPELFRRRLADSFAFLDGAPEELPEPPAVGVNIGFEAEADAPSGIVSFINARIVTMNGDQVIENGAVVVTGNRITGVGAMGEVPIPRAGTLIDLEGKTIIPGLIDAHAHGAQGTSGIIPQHNWSQYANLAFGVTTIHDPSNDTETIFAASEMQKAGLIRAPRIFSTGTILYGAAGADYRAEVDSLDDALFHLTRMQKVGAFSVKSYNQPRRDQRQQVLEAARRLGMLVVPEGGSTFMHNLTMVVDGHTTVEHNIPVETMYEDVLQLWENSATAITPTLVVSYGGISGEYYWYEHMDVWRHELLTTYVPRSVVDPRSRRRQKAPEGDYNHIKIAEGLKDLIDRGRLVNTGAHGQLAGLAEHWEIWMFAQGGMTPHEALKCATIFPARTLGMDSEIGSIEPGKLADLVILSADPLEDIRNTDSVHQVMVNGRLFDAATMNQAGNHPDTVGADAFGDGPDAIGVGKWWGVSHSEAEAHTVCSCGG
jgi:imidazolonepropionase-like amidohydrolase/Tol biopolymer transport system component